MKIIGLVLLVWILCLPPPVGAYDQDMYGGEVTSDTGRHDEYEVSRKRSETNEVRPLNRLLFREGPVSSTGGVPHVQGPNTVRVRKRLADSHAGLKFYADLDCTKCHGMHVMDIHTVRVGITCVQCHGAEPIASVDHYNSPMNPIRRHAYVCAKCHEGANAAFAGYVVHEPSPMDAATSRSFPALFWAFWIMVGITLLTFVLFLPHTLLWVIRELTIKRKGG